MAVGLGRLLHIQDERQLFPLDFHQPQRPVADFLAIGDDGDAHGVLEIIAGPGKREDVVHAGSLIPQPGPAIGFNVGIVILEDIPHSGKRFGCACVNAFDFRMRIGGGQDLGIQHSRKINVSCVDRLAACLLDSILPRKFSAASLYNFPAISMSKAYSP